MQLDLLDAHLRALKANASEPLEKPLVYFDEDRIDVEVLPAAQRDVIIAEGTYTGFLEHADIRAFIDRDYRQTKKARLRRGRDPDVAFLEQVLAIEHEIIGEQKAFADVIIEAPEDERRTTETP